MTIPSSTTSTTSPGGADSGHDLGEADESRREVESYHRRLADPGESDLPPALFARLTDLGTRVQLAYLTGHGRDEFPGYFGRDPVPPLWTDVRIESAGARSRNGRPDAVDVTVVWSGRPANGGPPVDHHTTIVLLINRDGEWQPQAQFGMGLSRSDRWAPAGGTPSVTEPIGTTSTSGVAIGKATGALPGRPPSRRGTGSAARRASVGRGA